MTKSELKQLIRECINEVIEGTIESGLGDWLEQNSSGYETSYDVDVILRDLLISKDSDDFGTIVSLMSDRGFELVGDKFIKKQSNDGGVSEEEVNDMADNYIKHLGTGSSLKAAIRDFDSLSQGKGDFDIRSGFSGWSDDNFKQLANKLRIEV